MSTKKLQILGSFGAEVDASLSIDGSAADAKATGDAIGALDVVVAGKADSDHIQAVDKGGTGATNAADARTALGIPTFTYSDGTLAITT